MTNNFLVSHIFPTYLMSRQLSDITAKYEKGGKYWLCSTRRKKQELIPLID